jgi:hypothetical protein
MCPKLKEGICGVAGLEPEYVECADKKCCHSSEWKWCKLYVIELLISNKNNFYNQFHRKEVA